MRLKTLIAIVLFVLALPAMASTPLVNSTETRHYSGASGENINDPSTWGILASSGDTGYYVFDDYPGCPYELTEPELCPQHERDWYASELENMPSGDHDFCTTGNCTAHLTAKCESADMWEWLWSGPGHTPGNYQGYAACNSAGPSFSRSIPLLAMDCECNCTTTYAQNVHVRSQCELNHGGSIRRSEEGALTPTA